MRVDLTRGGESFIAHLSRDEIAEIERALTDRRLELLAGNCAPDMDPRLNTITEMRNEVSSAIIAWHIHERSTK